MPYWFSISKWSVMNFKKFTLSGESKFIESRGLEEEGANQLEEGEI